MGGDNAHMDRTFVVAAEGEALPMFGRDKAHMAVERGELCDVLRGHLKVAYEMAGACVVLADGDGYIVAEMAGAGFVAAGGMLDAADLGQSDTVFGLWLAA